MKRHANILAAVLILGLTLALLGCCVHAGHDCVCGNCGLCLLIERVRSLFSAMAAVCLLMAGGCAVDRLISLLSGRERMLPAVTPVTLRVRLLD